MHPDGSLSFLKVRTKVLAFFRGKAEDREMGVTDFCHSFARGKHFPLRKKGSMRERKRRKDPVSGLSDTVFHGVFTLPLLGGLSYNAIYDKNYAK